MHLVSTQAPVRTIEIVNPAVPEARRELLIDERHLALWRAKGYRPAEELAPVDPDPPEAA